MSSAIHLDYREGLVAVKKTVKGPKGTYERTYYVKAGGAKHQEHEARQAQAPADETPATPKPSPAPRQRKPPAAKPSPAPAQPQHQPPVDTKPKTPEERAKEALHRFLNPTAPAAQAPAPAHQAPKPAAPTPQPTPAAPRPATTPVAPPSVTSKGGLKASAPAGDPSRAAADQEIRSLGGNPEHLDHMLGLSKGSEGWIKNTGTEGGMAMIMAGAKVYGLNAEPSIQRLQSTGGGFLSGESSEHRQAKLQRARKLGADPAAVASVRAMATASQARYSEDHVVLYRGLRHSRENPDGTHSIQTSALTSFTSDPKVARKFAGSSGRVVEVRVPRSSIVASHLASPQLAARRESEVIVASQGQFTGRLVKPGERVRPAA